MKIQFISNDHSSVERRYFETEGLCDVLSSFCLGYFILMFDTGLDAVGTKDVHVRVLLINDPLFPRPVWFHGVVESIQDSESCDPSSNLGGTFNLTFFESIVC